MTITPVEHETAARRVRDVAYCPNTRRARWVPAVNEVVPPVTGTPDTDPAPLVWALPVGDDGRVQCPSWFTNHQRAAYTGNVPGGFWAALAERERLHAMPAACRALNAKADAIARMVNEMTIANARCTLALNKLKRRGPLT